MNYKTRKIKYKCKSKYIKYSIISVTVLDYRSKWRQSVMNIFSCFIVFTLYSSVLLTIIGCTTFFESVQDNSVDPEGQFITTGVIYERGEFEMPLPDKDVLENELLTLYYYDEYQLPTDISWYIIKLCKKYGTDKFIMFELFRLESSFIETAVSVTGAYGFGQLFPIVKEDLMKRMDGFDELQIHNLYDNIHMAVAYFFVLQTQYKLGSLRECLIFYNTGKLKHLRESGEQYADIIMKRSERVRLKIQEQKDNDSNSKEIV